jgi:hypothetical protein
MLKTSGIQRYHRVLPIKVSMLIAEKILISIGAGALLLVVLVIAFSKLARVIVRESLGFPSSRSEISYSQGSPSPPPEPRTAAPERRINLK